MKIKPLLTEFIYIKKQLSSLGFDINPQPEDDGQCSFLIINRKLGSKLHLPNIEQVKGMVSCYLCFRKDDK